MFTLASWIEKGVCLSYVVVFGEHEVLQEQSCIALGETVEMQSAQLSTESCLHLTLRAGCYSPPA